MRVRVATLIADFLAARGVRHVFSVTGGGAMYLNDAFGHHDTLRCIYCHHEQACAMAAEGYARMGGGVAAVCVTSGPGGTNAITGVLGAWTDSVPMFVVSGQVKRETTVRACGIPLRQLGDQEYDIVRSVAPMTKYAQMITDEREVLYHLERAWHLCTHGRQGPVWLDVPIDVQSAEVETGELAHFDASKDGEVPTLRREQIDALLARLCSARRPVLLVGTGVRRAGAVREMLAFAKRLGAPLLTAWNAHDQVPDAHPLYCGRPSTVGTRGGNAAIQNADLLLVLGCRLNIRQIGYNYRAFAQGAYKIVVDIDENELKKPTVQVDLGIHADVGDVLRALLAREDWHAPPCGGFLAFAREVNERYPAVPRAYDACTEPLDPYVLLRELTRFLGRGARIVCGNGSACVMTFQAACIAEDMRLFTNSGCASMGYGLPAAIGACIAVGERVVCIEGDGSIQMNLQELQTAVHHGLDLKIFVLNNNGYHSIRQSQQNAFPSELVGVCAENGISFPQMERIAAAYGIPYFRLADSAFLEQKLEAVIARDGVVLCEAVVDETREFTPKVKARVGDDGSITSPPLDDMYPFLSREEYDALRYRE